MNITSINMLTFRILGNIERILHEKNHVRKQLNLPPIKKSDLSKSINSIFFRMKHGKGNMNLSTLIKWADILEIDIYEFFKPI